MSENTQATSQLAEKWQVWRAKAEAYYQRLLSLPNDSFEKTLAVAFWLCLICAVVVSFAAVALKPLQEANKAADMKRNILEVVGLYEPGMDVDAAFKQFEIKVVDLKRGDFVEDIDPNTYDMRKAARDPKLSAPVPKERDIAQVKRKPKYATVYLLKDENGELKAIVLPVWGYGLWSTMYGFLALEPDCNTVIGINFYDQGETPGLGGEVVNPAWRALWKGKKVYDESGQPVLRLVKGNVSPDQPGAEYMVDALAGATLTSNGVSNLIRFWLGEDGYKPFLDKFCGKL
ncbi:Na+-transporting NADH:ubiquinone oxidoreductase subunit C [Methylomarinovum caldicuralii]|uniref:Na(+)-translocating NADH-quinone reductase subunit C n=1 Tax=Methylomarinovum caldicuralii TaxID=438856 RepID=A0AAU9C2Z8_9GAMM|nr:Na(+)-translocating NADH-quinone reductase subunit C [Methylomarinovum caldicuralii]BCX82018.1 Na+-transporting NADH:ubiquinone oxidoreductase subunit C [Methylomarinovum caldicuralii]